MSKVTKGMAIAAANWWTEKISKNDVKSNGSYDIANTLASILATKMAEDHIPSTKSLDIFKESLVDIILKSDVHMLDTDYTPDSYLTEAAVKANIDTIVFPWKTQMYLSDGTVYVYDGYDSKKKIIYQEPIKFFKSLEQIEEEYSEVKDTITMSQYIINEIQNGLSLTVGEVYYLLYRAGEKDIDIKTIIQDDDYDIYYGATVYPRSEENKYDICCSSLMIIPLKITHNTRGNENTKYPFIVQDILGILKALGMEEKLFYFEYAFPINNKGAKAILDVIKDDIIITTAAVKEFAFPESKYYCSTMFNEKEQDKEGKFDLPFDNILDITCELLEELGFVNINDFVQYEFSVAYIYPNEKGKKVIEYIKSLK